EMNTNTAVSAIDIATTVYEICGIEKPVGLQGINVLENASLNARDVVFAETYAHDFSSIDSSLFYRVAIDLPYKLILPDEANKPAAEIELFNVVTDAFETENLAGSNPEKVEELRKKIEEWWDK
ncbi:MAG TPA: hypothetical protein VKA10_04225, partial [Prolixibacteraceae bacterium]|nr:hypothetical protein [Prolixibacteraceae bacterium]